MSKGSEVGAASLLKCSKQISVAVAERKEERAERGKKASLCEMAGSVKAILKDSAFILKAMSLKCSK